MKFVYIQLRPITDFFKKYSNGSNDCWVLVTGGSDGIGKAIAEDFAKRGFNIILIARTESKLKEVAFQIEKEFKVKTKYLAIDFSVIPQTYDFYENTFGNLFIRYNVVVLVNNVGAFNPKLFKDLSLTEAFKIVNMNCFPQAYLTSLFLKKATNKKAIINLSSISVDFVFKFYNVYGATKRYNDYLSKGVALENPGLDILSVRPSGVCTPMSQLKVDGIVTITPEKCSTGILKALGNTRVTNGYWTHILCATIAQLLPNKVVFNLSGKIFEKAFEDRY